KSASLIQTETYNDINANGVAESNELLSIQRTNYKDWTNNIVLPIDVQNLKGIYSNPSNILQDRITYVDYDTTNGNPLEISKADGTHIVYIWGYSKQYPIAIIENATYSQVSSQVSNLQSLSNSDSERCMDSVTYNCSEKNLRNALTSLRNSLPNAMVTTYTYDPLVGVTSITDPKGYTMYYEYDDFNRLKQVKDAAGILSVNEYHYKNQ